MFDYSDPPDTLSTEVRTAHDNRAERVESMGEAWICHFKSQTLRARLTQLGFRKIEDLEPPQISDGTSPAARPCLGEGWTYHPRQLRSPVLGQHWSKHAGDNVSKFP